MNGTRTSSSCSIARAKSTLTPCCASLSRGRSICLRPRRSHLRERSRSVPPRLLPLLPSPLCPRQRLLQLLEPCRAPPPLNARCRRALFPLAIRHRVRQPRAPGPSRQRSRRHRTRLTNSGCCQPSDARLGHPRPRSPLLLLLSQVCTRSPLWLVLLLYS